MQQNPLKGKYFVQLVAVKEGTPRRTLQGRIIDYSHGSNFLVQIYEPQNEPIIKKTYQTLMAHDSSLPTCYFDDKRTWKEEVLKHYQSGVIFEGDIVTL